MKHPSLFQSLLLKGPKALNYMSGSECIFPNAWESAGCLIPLPGCRWGTPTTALLSHSTGVGYGDINVWCSTGTRTEQTSEEAAPARPLQEEIEETTKEQEENIRDGYTASHALAQIPATWGEQLSFWTFSPNFHNSLLFHSAAEQSLPFSSVPWGSFPHPHFHLWKHKALKPRTQISHLKRKKKPQHQTIRWVQSLWANFAVSLAASQHKCNCANVWVISNLFRAFSHVPVMILELWLYVF